MLKLLGSLLLMVGAASLGFGAAAQLKARVSSLRSLVAALTQMERELAFRLTPMPELLDRLAVQTLYPARLLFAHCRDGMGRLGEIRLSDLWQEALNEETDLLLDSGEKQILTSLGDVLGRYDGDGQREAIQRTVADLRRCLERAEAEQERLGRVYGILGMGAGVMLVILLI